MLAGRLDGWTALTGVSARPGARANIALALLSGAPDPVFAAQLQDVTAEHQARARSEAAEKLTSATLDTAACVILVTDLEGRLVRVNAAATALSGYAEDELLGVPLWETALAPDGTPDAAALFAGTTGRPSTACASPTRRPAAGRSCGSSGTAAWCTTSTTVRRTP